VKTSTSGTSSAAGNFTATYRPGAGVWQYRLVVRASTTARTAVSSTRTITATLPPDTTAPGPVTTLVVSAVTDSRIKLGWTNPGDVDFAGVTIRRLVGDVAPATITEGTSVAVPASPTSTSFTDTGLSAVTQYSYAIFARDRAGNSAAAVKVVGWTAEHPPGPTAAVLSISPHNGAATTKLTVDGSFEFDASLSYPSPGQTLSTATLDYGDGTAAEALTGDSWSWVGSHAYHATGPKVVTLTVTDSAGVTVSDVVGVTVYGAPTAKIVATRPAQVDVPVTFDLTWSTPAGTSLTDYGLTVTGNSGTKAYDGAAPVPATKEVTFTRPGTHEVQFSVSNDAGGTSVVDLVPVNVAGAATSAVLSTSSNGVDTTKITLGAPVDFDASLSYAGPAGVTLASAVLDYGDQTPAKAFTGDQATWREAHSYVAAGTYPVTLRVTDSAGIAVSKVVSVTVSSAPTAAITIEGNPTGSVQAGVPVTFTLTPSTPVDTVITSWTVGGDWWDGGYGTPPPATVTHTFNAPGTYTVQFSFVNDALGTAESSMDVTVVP
jgi:PKD repeat protein